MQPGGIVGRWRTARYLAASLFISAPLAFVPGLLVGATATIAVAGLGLVLLPWVLTGLRRITDLERRRVGTFLGRSIPLRYYPLPPGVGARLRRVFRDPVTWRDVGWVFVQVIVGIPIGTIGLLALVGPLATVATIALWWAMPADQPMNMVGIPIDGWADALLSGAIVLALCAVLLWFVVPVLARLHARMAEKLLAASTTEVLSDRVDALTETRADALAAHANELRRIERDLHDGTQARLVAFAMRLGVAERALADDPATTARLLEEMRDGNEEAMAELRGVAKSIYPPILADRGLADASGALAAGCPVPVRTSVEDIGKLPAAFEAAAYFVLAESLTNVTKHASATGVELRVWRPGTLLCLDITDDGVGGLDESRGTGLLGIRRRVAALDGTTRIDSPSGGPTSIRVELPCGS